MLETVRENLKGTLVIVVIIIFIVPMVISGLGTSFLGGTGTKPIAEVEGESISDLELERAVRQQRSRLTAQGGLDASSPFLSEDYLRQPVLDNLTRRVALAKSAERTGMTISNSEFAKVLREQKEFFTDGKFDSQKYRNLLSQAQLTPPAYKSLVMRDLLLGQQAGGLEASSIVTNAEFEQLVKLTHQQRSFFKVSIDRKGVEETLTIDDSALQTFYEANVSDFEVPEKVRIDYVTLNLQDLAKRYTIDEQDIRYQYETETANFASDASYDVAHILIEDSNSARIDELSAKLKNGDSFADLASEYSDDIATNESGGALGVLTKGMFPEEFEEAVYGLEQGQVSEAVTTEAGTHFIKLVKKTVANIASYEERKEAIAQVLAETRAREDLPSLIDELGDLTFSASDLTEVAKAMNLEVLSSSFFDRATGSGIADSDTIRKAAFDTDVYENGANSNVLELGEDQYVVLRLNEKKASYIKPFEDVKAIVLARVKAQTLTETLASLASEFKEKVVEEKTSAEALATELAYDYVNYEDIKRNDISVGSDALDLAFSAPVPNEGNISVAHGDGNNAYVIVGVSSVEEGDATALSDAEKRGFMAQLKRSASSIEGAAFEAQIIASADIDVFADEDEE